MTILDSINALRHELEGDIVGQSDLVNRLLIALLVDGHLLVEGAPGLAKTRAIKSLADRLEGDFRRLQFTPDLLPADLTGTEVYRPADGSFAFQPGPLFSNLILADEINRAPAKVQSALLEAMAEQQISVGHETYALPELFMVMATQNPIEQEGTYPLPEAQLDRFLMQIIIDYPPPDREVEILRLVRGETLARHQRRHGVADPAAHSANAALPVERLSLQAIFAARQAVLEVHLADNVEDYLVRLVTATRRPGEHLDTMRRWVAYGSSPRGTIALDACSRAHAWLAGRDYVSPADVQAVIHDVLRHRLILSFEAEAEGITATAVVDALLNTIAVP